MLAIKLKAQQSSFLDPVGSVPNPCLILSLQLSAFPWRTRKNFKISILHGKKRWGLGAQIRICSVTEGQIPIRVRLKELKMILP